MKAVVYDTYGPPDVLRLQEIEKPSITDDEILVRVRAASLNPYDWHFLTGLPYLGRLSFGLLKPKANGLGADFAGQVAEVGRNVTRFRPGDEVWGEVETGAFAEYVSVSEESMALKPANLSFEEAAAVPMGALTALQGLRDHGKLQPGQKVLVNGASGGVGTFGVQIAKVFGAEVTGVCSTANVDLVRSIGADHVIDYTRQDFTQGEERYDIILDNAGKHSLSEMRQAVSPTGKLIPNSGTTGGKVFGPIGRMLRASLSAMFVRKQAPPFVAGEKPEDMLALKGLIEAGTITPVIDQTYPLTKTAAAMTHVAAGHASGKTLIAVAAG